MTTTRERLRRARVRRRVLRVVLAWLGFQAALAGAGLLAARKLDEGDEASARIRRVRLVGGFELRPTAADLSSVRLDLAMAGAELDLTGVQPPAGGVDLTLNLAMGGVGVKVPPGWRVWWKFLGVGGMGADEGVQRVATEAEADLRIRASVLFGGVGVEAAS
jgi:hypothetical protein